MSKHDPARQALLLAETDATARRFIGRALRDNGYATLEAKSGSDAVSQASSYDGEIPLAILNVKMPSVGALDVANHLRRERPRTDFLYVSARSKSLSLQSLLHSDPERVLLRPFSATTLIDRVRRLLAVHTCAQVRRIIEAGDRLQACLAAEEAFLRLVEQYADSPDVFARWKEARRGVERAQKEYDDCVRKSAEEPALGLLNDQA